MVADTTLIDLHKLDAFLPRLSKYVLQIVIITSKSKSEVLSQIKLLCTFKLT